jgi:hypothetical protein
MPLPIGWTKVNCEESGNSQYVKQLTDVIRIVSDCTLCGCKRLQMKCLGHFRVGNLGNSARALIVE